MKKKMEIPAVHDRDLRSILEKYNLAEKIDRHELRCARCYKEISWDNISAFRVNGNDLNLYCNAPGCIEFASLG